MLFLNDRQDIGLQLALRGHNLFITGQAGTGKTFTLQQIAKDLLKTEKKVCITTTTGMAAMQYINAGLPATTIHFWAGIMDGRFTTPNIVDKIVSDEAYIQVKNRILDTDILLIDEVSMLSKFLFRQIFEICKAVRKPHAPFGAMQIIAGGSFKQLSPIPNPRYGDDGDFCFNCPEWEMTFPIHHSINLDVIMRTNEDTLIATISELENGSPSPRTENLLRSLNRKLLTPDSLVTHLFATREDVNMFNTDMLEQHEGQIFTYKAIDDKVTNRNMFRVPKILKFKKGVPVILQSNLNMSIGLVNGRKGTIVDCNDDSVVVEFDGHIETITKFNYSQYDPKKMVITATRKQLPLNLGFSVTVHKAQGMTLEHLEVDCYSMFCPGQMAVALGRATHIGGLRVVNYNPTAASLKHDNKVFQIHDDISAHTPNYTDIDSAMFLNTLECCSNTDNFSESLKPTAPTKVPVSTVVHATTVEIPEDILQPILPFVTTDNLFSFNPNSPFNDFQVEMVYLFNNIKHRNATIALWNSVIELTQSDLDTHNSKDWKPHTKNFHNFLSKTVPESHLDNIFVGLRASEAAKRSLLYKIGNKARDNLLMQEANKQVPEVQVESEESFDEASMAVIRYVAGYAISSLRKRCNSSYARNSERNVKSKWMMLRGMCTPYSIAKENTDYPDSFSEITRRGKSTGNGLACPTDSAFNFFIYLHMIAVKYINPTNISAFQGDIFGIALKAVLGDEQLYTTWFSAIPQASSNTHQSEDDQELEVSNSMALLDELVPIYVSILLADAKKKSLAQRSRKKTTSLRKGLSSMPNNTQPKSPKASTSQTNAQPKSPKASTSQTVTKRAPSKRKLVKYPCGKCSKECHNSDCIECSLCELWYHFNCVNLSGSEYFITNENMDFYCPDCDIDTEVHTKGKRIKRKV